MRNITEWQLFHLAQSFTRARRLEKLRNEFHAELYECIVYPSVQLDLTRERGSNPSTDIQAIKIIQAKERYEKQVQKEHARSVRWKGILDLFSDSERIIMIRYFEKKKNVCTKIIDRLLLKIERQLDRDEKRIEQERTEQSTKDNRAHQRVTVAFKKPVEVKQTNKKQYMIDGRFIYMTEEEYTIYQEEKKAAEMKFHERLAHYGN